MCPTTSESILLEIDFNGKYKINQMGFIRGVLLVSFHKTLLLVLGQTLRMLTYEQLTSQ